MPIEFRCPNCNQLLRTPDASAGKQARCPGCGQISPVPAVSGGPAGSPLNPFADAGNVGLAKASAAPDFNPYAAPTAFDKPAKEVVFSGELSRQTIEMGEVLGAAWRVFSEEMGKCVGAGAVMFGVNFGLQMVNQVTSMIFQALASTENTAAIIVGVLLLVLGIVVQIAGGVWLQAGVTIFSLKMARNRSGAINDLFAGWPFFWRYFGYGLLIGLGTLAILLICAAVLVGVPAAIGGAIAGGEGAGWGAIGGAIAAILAYIVAATWFILTVFLGNYFIVDRNEGVVAAMHSSAQFMRGNRLSAFAVMLVAGLLSIPVVCITCGVGQIFTAPFFGILGAMIYLMVTGQPHAAQLMTPPAKPIGPI
jgi:hypothetical protein